MGAYSNLFRRNNQFRVWLTPSNKSGFSELMKLFNERSVVVTRNLIRNEVSRFNFSEVNK